MVRVQIGRRIKMRSTSEAYVLTVNLYLQSRPSLNQYHQAQE